MDIKHLTKETIEALSFSKKKRIQWLHSSRWIGYPLAQEILKKLEWLLSLEPIDRMPNLLLYGQTNNGKTTIVRHFAKINEPLENPCTGMLEFPVLYLQMPPSPEESRFYDSLLNLLMAPYRQRDSISRKQAQCITIMKNIGVKMLIIDEFHHLLIGRPDRQRLFLQSLKYLGNELRIPIVATGTEDALRAVRVVPQISNRYDQIELPKWKLNNNFRRLLISFERVLPLEEPSNLKEVKIATKLYSMCEGNIGELSRILNLATTEVINKNGTKITLDIISKLDWTQPSCRLG